MLFTLPPSPFSSSLLCIRHDIDALVYSPKIESKALLWTHIGTFNALGYVQASKREKKFLTASSDLSFAVLCDCTRHVFVYQQPKGGVKGPTALQYIQSIRHCRPTQAHWISSTRDSLQDYSHRTSHSV